MRLSAEEGEGEGCATEPVGMVEALVSLVISVGAAADASSSGGAGWT